MADARLQRTRDAYEGTPQTTAMRPQERRIAIRYVREWDLLEWSHTDLSRKVAEATQPEPTAETLWGV